jgi:hypothetical protein
MDYRLDDWVYWHVSIITVDYNSSHIELLLNYVCLTNLSQESRTDLSLISDCFECTNQLPFMIATRAE